ncbi:MAG TPA: RES family NAD+ phosphorylase [Hyphomonadaceae bacterium]
MIDAFPVILTTVERAVRLVSTARLRKPVLADLVGEEDLETLAEIEGATSDRLLRQRRGGAGISPMEFVFGVPGHSLINAAFAYARPRGLNRFNGPNRGAWYAAFEVETAIAEVSFHLTRELDNIGVYKTNVDYAELFASFAGEFLDLRSLPDPQPECLNPDIEIGYPHGNAVADAARTKGLNGIIYPSVRRQGGTCLVALIPHAVQSVAQGRVIRLIWKGKREPDVVLNPAAA